MIKPEQYINRAFLNIVFNQACSLLICEDFPPSLMPCCIENQFDEQP